MFLYYILQRVYNLEYNFNVVPGTNIYKRFTVLHCKTDFQFFKRSINIYKLHDINWM